MEGNDDNNISFGEKAKLVWKALPKTVKLYILGGVGVLILIIIIASVFLGLTPSIFLNFSDDVQSSDDFKSEYEEYWSILCEEGDNKCSEEQIKAAKELRESQEDFYDKLDALVKKYNITNEQKYIVLTTIFYGLDIDSFTKGTGAFDLDDTDEINYEVEDGADVYKREKDSLKELIKQFKINTAICYHTVTLENGETESKSYSLQQENGQAFTFNFFDKVQFAITGKLGNDSFEEEKEACLVRPNGEIKIETSTSSQASIDGYYKYLRESTYFDDKPHLSNYFTDYAKSHNLSKDTNTWTEEDKMIVRDGIIDDIKSIVKEYTSKSSTGIAVSTGTAYWWPIGSVETTVVNGKTFASGDPQFTIINSPFGKRDRPTGGASSYHQGIDLHGILGETNIIASLGGEVLRTNNTCVSRSHTDNKEEMGCGGKYGNFVEIQDTKGNVTIYAHMSKDSITVSKGDIVSQGQVIGKVGSSGTSTGAHLHFGIKVNGSFQDPLDYVSIENPRPAGGADVNFNQSRYTKEEFIAVLENYYQNVSCSRPGCTDFKNQVINARAAEKIYDEAAKKNINPEILVVRAYLEGYSPGTDYNYYGYGCTNTGGLKACYTFGSFEAGAEEFFKNISKYSSLEDMMSRYAYLGDYWYTGNHSGLGGCYYAEYIYPDGVPDRVTQACAHPDGYCSASDTSKCEATTEEDRAAYTAWQVRNMAREMDRIFASGG